MAKEKTVGGIVRDLLSIGRVHIVAIGALGTFTFGYLFTGKQLFGLALISGLDWFLVNWLNRVVDLKEDTVNQIRGTDLVGKNPRAFAIFGFTVLGASFVALHIFFPQITTLRAAYHALGLSYNYPFLPGKKRIKELYFWKNTASATGFLITVFGYPLASSGGTFPPGITWATVVIAGLFFFAFELSYEVIYDLRDAPGDAAANVRTYPVVHGEQGAVRIIDTLIFASMAVLAVGYALNAVPWRLFIMIAAPLLQLGVYKRSLRRGITSATCIGLTWLGAGLLFTYHLWIAFRLPGAGL
ncbi:MAG: UbiA family prenyltransferase [Polyangiaceae bacterium]|nr:UbiA family prenyltransferase [Polyangiaceae bacterium]